MTTFNLSSDQAARINYDSANGNYFDDQIAQYVAAGGELAQIDRSTFDVWFDVDQEDVDDTEEAEARAWSTFQERLATAKKNAFVTLLSNSDYGVEIPYAGSYTAYVSPDDERGGYFLSYCQGEMPPHAKDHADTAEEAATKIAETCELSRARVIEAE